MAFDGITIANLTYELENALAGGKINKITQPEIDELMLVVKNNRNVYRLLLSASASLPLAYLTGTNKPAPLTAPNFCMLLRKHIGNGHILTVTQPNLERILEFHIEHLNELGDICHKKLIVELMGKHSNIIFCTEDNKIIDSIKHISSNMSSLREVLPGRDYFIPATQEKQDPFLLDEDGFQKLFAKPMPLAKAIYTSITGFSPIMAEELCHRASLDGGLSADAFGELEQLHLFRTFRLFIEDLQEHRFSPSIYYKGKEPCDFSAFPMSVYSGLTCVQSPDMSTALEQYYSEKSHFTRIRQKSSDLRRIVQTALERSVKKYQLQEKQMKDTEKREKLRIYGELLNTYGYQLSPEDKTLETINYYTGEAVSIPLDTTLTPKENAQKYFEKYGKLKRTAAALEKLLLETHDDIEHLRSISTALDLASGEGDLAQIKDELSEYGYIRRHGAREKRTRNISAPLHFVSSDGFDIYVGKNNYQNESLTFHFASGNDWWFHAKNMPGSHVIVKTNGRELPDRTFEEAGRLAGYFSSGRTAPKVEIDYTLKKNVKKPSGGKPGFVVYYTNYSLLIEPDISNFKQIS